MANGIVQIQSVGGGTTYATIAMSGTGFTFLTPLYKYANLTLAYSPNDPGLQFTYVNSSLAASVFLQARFFNLLNEPSQGVSVNVGTSAFPSSVSGTSNCIDVRSTGAVGDGVADDTDAIQTALDKAALNASGKTAQVSKGLRIVQSNTGQVATNVVGGTGNLVIPMTKVTTKGNVLVFMFDAFHWANPPTIQDTGGNNYVQFAAVPDGEHVTYGYWALNNSGGAISAIAAESGGRSNSFIIGVLAEVQSLTTPVTLDGVVATNFSSGGPTTFNTGTVTLTNALDTVFSFLYISASSSTPSYTPPVGYTSLARDAFPAAGGRQEVVAVSQDIAISGASQSLGAQWGLDGTENGVIGFTVAFKAQPLSQTVPFTGPTTVCIPFGVNCLVSYRSIDVCDGVWYSQSQRCLTMDNGVTLLIDGSIIKKKEDLFVPIMYIDPVSTIDFDGRSDGARTLVLSGFDSSGNPATETYIIGPSTATGTVTWSAVTGGTVTPPFSYPVGPSDLQAPSLVFATPSGGGNVLDMMVVNGQIKLGNQPFPITKKSNLVFNPPSQLYAYRTFSSSFTATITLVGQDQNGNDVTDVITVSGGTSGTSAVIFSKLYSGTCQTAAGQNDIGLFYYPLGAQVNSPYVQIGYFQIQNGVGHVVTSGSYTLGQFPGGGWIVENKNAFTPFSQFGNNNSNQATFYKTPQITNQYDLDVPAAHSYEGYRNANISIVGSGQVILNGDWAYRNADQNFGLFAIGNGISHVGFARFCACDNLTIEGLEIISPCRAAINVMHSDSPVIENLYIHDGHGDDLGLCIPFDQFDIDTMDGVINVDFCRNARVTLNRLYSNEWGGVADWSSFQSLIQQNDIQGGRFGYQFVSLTQEFFWTFFITNNFSGTIGVNNEISGNRATGMTQPTAPPTNNSSGFGWGFGFFDDGGPGRYDGGAGNGSDGASGISFHDNVANSNVVDFLATTDIFFRSLYNNSFESGGPNPIVNGQQSVSNETPSGVINGTNAVFTLAHSPVGGTLDLTLNGLLQTQGVDYTLSGNTITFVTPPPIGNTLLASYRY